MLPHTAPVGQAVLPMRRARFTDTPTHHWSGPTVGARGLGDYPRASAADPRGRRAPALFGASPGREGGRQAKQLREYAAASSRALQCSKNAQEHWYVSPHRSRRPSCFADATARFTETPTHHCASPTVGARARGRRAPQPAQDIRARIKRPHS